MEATNPKANKVVFSSIIFGIDDLWEPILVNLTANNKLSFNLVIIFSRFFGSLK